MLDDRQKARLSWHCRRGMLELDLILQQFIEKTLDSLNDDEIAAFDRLLSCTDPELFSWLMGHEIPDNKEFIEIVARIRNTH